MEECIEFFIEFASDNITDKELKDIATIFEIINPLNIIILKLLIIY